MADVTVTSSGLVLNLPGRFGLRRLAALACLILVLAAAGAALVLEQQGSRQIADASRTEELRRQARDLLIGLTEAESSQRGFLLTKDARYRESFEAALDFVDAQYASLLESSSTWPSQHSRIVSIGTAVEDKKGDLSRSVSFAAAGEDERARTAVTSGTAETLLGGIRNTVDGIIAAEDAQLVERNAAIGRNRVLLVSSIMLALAGAAGLASALFYRSSRQVRELARSQGRLRSQNEELELRVMGRTAELEEARAHAERERQRVEGLLQDANHRIGNSLATVSSLLGLQVIRARSEEVKAALESARARVHAIASGHRRLRLGDDMETVRADEFLDAVAEDLRLMRSPGTGIEMQTKFLPLNLRARDATTIGIILGELVTNALKHAFKGANSGHIWISLERRNGAPELTVEDDGAGMTAEIASNSEGLGSVIIRQLSQPFGGQPEFAGRAGGGTRVSIALPGLTVLGPDLE